MRVDRTESDSWVVLRVKPEGIDFRRTGVFAVATSLFFAGFALAAWRENPWFGVLPLVIGLVFLLVPFYLLVQKPVIRSNASTRSIEIEERTFEVSEKARIVLTRVFRKFLPFWLNFRGIATTEVWTLTVETDAGVELLSAVSGKAPMWMNSLAESLSQIFHIELVDRTGDSDLVIEATEVETSLVDQLQTDGQTPLEDLSEVNKGVVKVRRMREGFRLEALTEPWDWYDWLLSVILVVTAVSWLVGGLWVEFTISGYIDDSPELWDQLNVIFFMLVMAIPLFGGLWLCVNILNTLAATDLVTITNEGLTVAQDGIFFRRTTGQMNTKKLERVIVVKTNGARTLELMSNTVRIKFPGKYSMDEIEELQSDLETVLKAI